MSEENTTSKPEETPSMNDATAGAPQVGASQVGAPQVGQPQNQQYSYTAPQGGQYNQQYAPQQNYQYQQNNQYNPQPQYGAQLNQKARTEGLGSVQKDKWVAALLSIPPLGALGIAKFYLGYKTEGLIMLLVALVGGLCLGIGWAIMSIVAIIEAVKYVTLTQEDFQSTYIRNYKGWL